MFLVNPHVCVQACFRYEHIANRTWLPRLAALCEGRVGILGSVVVSDVFVNTGWVQHLVAERTHFPWLPFLVEHDITTDVLVWGQVILHDN